VALQAEAKRRGVSIDRLIAELAKALPADTPIREATAFVRRVGFVEFRAVCA
jgi:hypothetical protein